jgi:hypothetical protein
MKKTFSLVLTMVVALSFGLAIIHCGDDNGEEVTCPDNAECCDAIPCAAGQVCTDGVCEVSDCCEGKAYHADIAGTIIAFPPANPPTPLAGMALAPIAAYEALTSPDPTHLTDATSDENGQYQTDCMDLKGVSLGILILSDDPGFDGPGGDYYPTYSGVMAIGGNEDKVCEDNAPTIFGVPNTLITALTQVPDLANITTDGLGIVLVVDKDQAPVAGAQLKTNAEDGSMVDLPNNAVVYPNADFSAFDGTETSANGVALIAGPMTLTYIQPTKEGMTWTADPMAIVAGFCLSVPMLALE